MTIQDSKEFAKRVRIDVAKILNRTKDSHIGGGYSSVDILSVLYTRILNLNLDNLESKERNVFILSKGHIAATMFTVLAHAGIIPMEDLEKHLVDGENYAGHTRRYVVKGVEMSAGSLGHGSGVGAGMAYAKKMQAIAGNVYVLMGDGECNEGSVWEAAMFASRFQLSNLILIVDRNRLQAYGRDEEVLNMGDLKTKFESFGCQVFEVNGHNHEELYHVFEKCNATALDKPKVIVANTIKGYGVSFMEDKLEWHFKSPDDEQLRIAIEEITAG